MLEQNGDGGPHPGVSVAIPERLVRRPSPRHRQKLQRREEVRMARRALFSQCKTCDVRRTRSNQEDM